jgi:hypothetical protein
VSCSALCGSFFFAIRVFGKNNYHKDAENTEKRIREIFLREINRKGHKGREGRVLLRDYDVGHGKKSQKHNLHDKLCDLLNL